MKPAKQDMEMENMAEENELYEKWSKQVEAQGKQLTRKEFDKYRQRFPQLDLFGNEMLDPNSDTVTSKLVMPGSLEAKVQEFMRKAEIRKAYEDLGYETPEEADDFDIPDEEFMELYSEHEDRVKEAKMALEAEIADLEAKQAALGVTPRS